MKKLEFSEKYSTRHARDYYQKHGDGFWRRLSNFRENQMVGRALALAGQPQTVLDLPCGTGRFWPLLTRDPDRTLMAGDYSEGMLETAAKLRMPEVGRKIPMLRCSAFAIPLVDNAVDSVCSIRFFHHVGEAADRLTLLREYGRVARDTVILSLWVDGNYKARRRLQLDASRTSQPYRNRFVIRRAVIESEFRKAGLDVIGKVDFLPGYSMWRCYVLKSPGSTR